MIEKTALQYLPQDYQELLKLKGLIRVDPLYLAPLGLQVGNVVQIENRRNNLRATAVIDDEFLPPHKFPEAYIELVKIFFFLRGKMASRTSFIAKSSAADTQGTYFFLYPFCSCLTATILPSA